MDPIGLGTLFGPFLAACLQVFRCLVLRAFCKLAMVGRSVPTGLGTIKHYVAMFSGKQNAILLESQPCNYSSNNSYHF